LSSEYEGTSFSGSYSVDPTTGETLGLLFDLNLPADEVITACNGGFDHYGAMIAAMNQLMSIALPRSYEHERQKVLKEAVRAGISEINVVPGERPTPAQAAELLRVIAERITPCIVHQAKAWRMPIKPPGEPEDS
jgi:hypothetical protein